MYLLRRLKLYSENTLESNVKTNIEPVELESNPVARKALLIITLVVAVFLGYLLYSLK